MDGESQFKTTVSFNASRHDDVRKMSMLTNNLKAQANSVEKLWKAKHSTLEKTLSESTKLQDTSTSTVLKMLKRTMKQALLYQEYPKTVASARKASEELEKQQSDNADALLVKQVEEQRLK